MRHAGSSISLLIFVSLSAHCQRVVSGSVLDGETKQGIPFAAVHIANSTIGVSCDEMGIFSLYIPQEKENTSVVISALGYRPDTMYIQKLHGNKCIATLQPAAIQLGGVEVVEYATARKLMDAIFERIPQNYRTDEAVGIWYFGAGGC
ncbi:MAG: carboxypeptidase-like regulatory domain-containing protein [Bacteroidales bacterium]|nr:carboxypeptidase-like regulatory domain-containing protein [Bacteroidales bacterium]